MSISKKGLDPSSIGRGNVEMIFRLIQREGGISRTDIAEKTGLSKTAVSSSVNQLLERDLILEDKHKRYSKVGRKPRILSVNADGRYFISIDIGGTTVKYGIGNLVGDICSTKTIQTPDHWENLFTDITYRVENCGGWSGISPEKISALAIAVPGVVNADGTISYVPNIEGLDRVKLGSELEKTLDLPILLENDVNASVLGEYRERRSNYSNIVFIAVGTGVGGGIIFGGELYRGSLNHAGEVGWFVPSLNEMEGDLVDSKGPLESRISGPDLVKRAKEMLTEYPDDPLSEKAGELNPKLILSKRDKSRISRHLTEDWINEISLLIANITTIIDPELVVIGGGVSKTGGKYIDEIREKVKQNTQTPPEIDLTTLGDDAPLYGGLAVCRHNYSRLLWNSDEGVRG